MSSYLRAFVAGGRPARPSGTHNGPGRRQPTSALYSLGIQRSACAEPNLGSRHAIFSTGSGRIKLKIDKQDREIHYELTYAFPDAGATPVVGAQFVNQAHLHFGQKHTTGGITVWLCQSADNPAPASGRGYPDLPEPFGESDRDHPSGERSRACWPGIPRRRGWFRCPSGSPPDRRDLRERPHRPVPPRRDPRPAGS